MAITEYATRAKRARRVTSRNGSSVSQSLAARLTFFARDDSTRRKDPNLFFFLLFFFFFPWHNSARSSFCDVDREEDRRRSRPSFRHLLRLLYNPEFYVIIDSVLAYRVSFLVSKPSDFLASSASSKTLKQICRNAPTTEEAPLVNAQLNLHCYL